MLSVAEIKSEIDEEPCSSSTLPVVKSEPEASECFLENGSSCCTIECQSVTEVESELDNLECAKNSLIGPASTCSGVGCDDGPPSGSNVLESDERIEEPKLYVGGVATTDTFYPRNEYFANFTSRKEAISLGVQRRIFCGASNIFNISFVCSRCPRQHTRTQWQDTPGEVGPPPVDVLAFSTAVKQADARSKAKFHAQQLTCKRCGKTFARTNIGPYKKHVLKANCSPPPDTPSIISSCKIPHKKLKVEVKFEHDYSVDDTSTLHKKPKIEIKSEPDGDSAIKDSSDVKPELV